MGVWEKMIWADRAAAGVAAMIALCGFALFVIFMIGTSMAGFFSILWLAIEYIAILSAVIALPLWLVLRIVDLIQGGPGARRRAQAHETPPKDPA